MAHLVDSEHDALNHQPAYVGDTFELLGKAYITAESKFECEGCAFKHDIMCHAAPDCAYNDVIFVALPKL